MANEKYVMMSTNPTGTAIINFGFAFPLFINSFNLNKAVGAFPKTNISTLSLSLIVHL